MNQNEFYYAVHKVGGKNRIPIKLSLLNVNLEYTYIMVTLFSVRKKYSLFNKVHTFLEKYAKRVTARYQLALVECIKMNKLSRWEFCLTASSKKKFIIQALTIT